MRKKVGVFLGATPFMGGKYQYSLSLIDALEALPASDYETVIAYGDSVWEEELAEVGARCFKVPCPTWSYALGTGLTWSGIPVPLWQRTGHLIDPMARRLRKERCDLWVFSSYSFLTYQIGVPCLGIIHDLMHRYERQFPEVSARGIYTWRERSLGRMCRWAEGILVDSELGRRQVADSYGTSESKIHPLPFVPPRYIHTTGDLSALKSKYDLPDRFVFYPAQFWEHKNHRRLVEAIRAVKQTSPDVQLVLVGSKKNGYGSLVQSVRDLGVEENVRFLGFVPNADLSGLYRLACALVMPTFFGPTNIPPLEAFVAGCPVAVSGIYAMPEQVGDAGVLFDPESVEEMAAAVDRLWTDDDLCRELAERGRARAAAWGQAQFNDRFREIVGTVLSTT